MIPSGSFQTPAKMGCPKKGTPHFFCKKWKAELHAPCGGHLNPALSAKGAKVDCSRHHLSSSYAVLLRCFVTLAAAPPYPCFAVRRVPRAKVRSRDLDRSGTAACLAGGAPLPGHGCICQGHTITRRSGSPYGAVPSIQLRGRSGLFLWSYGRYFLAPLVSAGRECDGLRSSAQPIAAHLKRLGTSAILCHDCKNVHLDRLRFSSQDSEAFRGWFPHRHAIRIGDSHNAKIFMAPGPVVHSRRS